MSDELAEGVENEEVWKGAVDHDAVSDEDGDGKCLSPFPFCLFALIWTLQDSKVNLNTVTRA